MRPTTGKCFSCSADISIAPVGRPRRFCSNACRLKAQRDRRQTEVVRVLVGGMTVQEYAGIDPGELLGTSARDPDAAVLECIFTARATAAEFGVTAKLARREFAWRCDAMADHIAAGLRKYFER